MHSIDTSNEPPINQPPYHAGFKKRAVIIEKIRDMKKKGAIQASRSPWASHGHGDDRMRFCIDYRKLNHTTKNRRLPKRLRWCSLLFKVLSNVWLLANHARSKRPQQISFCVSHKTIQVFSHTVWSLSRTCYA
jgi:hypothetical protein